MEATFGAEFEIDLINDEGVRSKIDSCVMPFGSLPHGMTPIDKEGFNRFVSEHPDDYYQYLAQSRDGSTIENLDVCGAQFYVGHENSEVLLKRYNALRWGLPFFSGISASSPLRNGRFNGYASERVRVKKLLPGSGVPPVISSLESLERLLSVAPNVRHSESPGYYLMRFPRLDINTTELCAADMTPEVDMLQMMADVYHRLCRKIDRMNLADLPAEVFGEACIRLSAESQVFIEQRLNTVNKLDQRLPDQYINLGGVHLAFAEWAQHILRFIEDEPSEGFSSVGVANDGVIEMIEHQHLPWLGGQWHPEFGLPIAQFECLYSVLKSK